MRMEIRFASKRALVTGAGKGIGREIVKKLAQCGAECVAVSRTQADLDSLKDEVPGIHTVQVDLGDWIATREAMEKVGNIDLLVNNAGIAHLSSFLETTREDLDKVFDVNIKSLFNVSQIVAKGMVERGNGGAIVNVSSIASKIGLRDHAAYCSSKGAVDSLTQVMALELGPHKIRVNAVNPTVVMTDMGRMAWSDPSKSGPLLARIPLGKFVDVDDVVNTVLFLLSDQAASLNGIALPIEGGLLAN
ncbi:hypothetical protein CHS0354_005745 [Potamilus streckersoni]|uniref:Ketoreductase domain-containing protein n=1 Tax=Potamilus streckersoni TaxID=2493646 RepID=A0AAE0RWS6_9BIVA|nr:hypothetical protein CHS0354_005745 [Potamilus streckersoni]